MVIERLDGTYMEGNPETSQNSLHRKAEGVLVAGNEDRAHDVCSTVLFNLIHLGCTVPPNSGCYWVGDPVPGPSYIKAGGDGHLYTNRAAIYRAHNLVYFAKLLKENLAPINLKKLDEGQKSKQLMLTYLKAADLFTKS